MTTQPPNIAELQALLADAQEGLAQRATLIADKFSLTAEVERLRAENAKSGDALAEMASLANRYDSQRIEYKRERDEAVRTRDGLRALVLEIARLHGIGDDSNADLADRVEARSALRQILSVADKITPADVEVRLSTQGHSR